MTSRYYTTAAQYTPAVWYIALNGWREVGHFFPVSSTCRWLYICPVFFEESRSGPSGVGFSPDAALRFAVLFAGFLRCDNRTIMKSFLKKIAREFSGNFVGFLCKFPVNSWAIFLGNDFIIVWLSHFRNPAINLRIAELCLMRNPPLKWL